MRLNAHFLKYAAASVLTVFMMFDQSDSMQIVIPPEE